MGHLLKKENVELAVGTLGDGTSIAQAFQPRSSQKSTTSHIIFAAGGEDADYDAVNNRGVAECAKEGAKAGSKTMVVISAAWVSKPYSLASVLFNSLYYPQSPMGKHLQGEDALRRVAASSGMHYVILRAGRLVPDDEFPADKPTGLLYEQGDNFSFFGPAGMPGMSNTQLMHAVMTATTKAPNGKFTVEVTGGTTDAQDSTIYHTFLEDDVSTSVSDEHAHACHAEPIDMLKRLAIMFPVLFLVNVRTRGLRGGLAPLLFTLVMIIVYWNGKLSNVSVQECAAQKEAAAASSSASSEL